MVTVLDRRALRFWQLEAQESKENILKDNKPEPGVSAGSAQHVVDFLKSTTWANKDTTLTVYTVRQLLRIIRRFSLAVLDQSNPTYGQSGLYYLERNEEIFGRKRKEVVLQESAKYLDSFQVRLSQTSKGVNQQTKRSREEQG